MITFVIKENTHARREGSREWAYLLNETRMTLSDLIPPPWEYSPQFSLEVSTRPLKNAIHLKFLRTGYEFVQYTRTSPTRHGRAEFCLAGILKAFKVKTPPNNLYIRRVPE